MCTQPVQPWDEIVIVGSLVDFRVEARHAIRAEIQEAARLRDVHVEPWHRNALTAELKSRLSKNLPYFRTNTRQDTISLSAALYTFAW